MSLRWNNQRGWREREEWGIYEDKRSKASQEEGVRRPPRAAGDLVADR